MTTPRDPDRLIRSFLLEGDEHLHDRVYDAVRADIDHRRQRVVIGPWRTPDIMNKLVPLGLGAAAVVMALIVGSRLLGAPEPGGVGGDPSAEPTSTVSPPAASPSTTPAAGGLSPGASFVLTTGERSIDGMPMQRVDVTIPAAGWDGDPGSGILTKNSPNAPDGAGMIVFFGDLFVYGDPCRWSTTRPDAPATTVDEIIAALSAQSSRDASEPIDVILDGHVGKGLTLHVPDDAAFGTCDRSTFGSWGLAGADQTPMRFHQDPGQIDEVWVVDVDGLPVTVDWSYYAGTSQSVVDELREVVESITFG